VEFAAACGWYFICVVPTALFCNVERAVGTFARPLAVVGGAIEPPAAHFSIRLRRKMSLKHYSWQSGLYMAAGLGTAVFGKAAGENSGDTWPIILVVVGLYFIAAGVAALRP
jgi:hypothetical protein